MATAFQIVGLILAVAGMGLWFGVGACLVTGGVAVTAVATAAELRGR